MARATTITEAKVDAEVVANQSQYDGVDTGGNSLCCPNFLSCCASTIVPCVWVCSCVVVEENTGLVVLSNGKLSAAITDPGLHAVNPCCTQKFIVSQKQRCLQMQKIKVIDLKGNPIIIRAIVVFRVRDVIKASLEVENYSGFVLTQATAVLKSVASKYPYESSDGGESLKEDAAAVTHELIRTLQAKVNVAGISVIDFVLNELSYAPEIAQSMLVRQQAEALLGARTQIVTGAVEIAKTAARDLAAGGLVMTDDEKARMVSNLMCIICGDADDQKPTLTEGV